MRFLAPLFCLALLTTAAHADSGIVKKKVAASFDDTRDAITLAIEGLVPRLRDPDYVRSIIEAVRAEWTGPIHVFGVVSVVLDLRHR